MHAVTDQTRVDDRVLHDAQRDEEGMTGSARSPAWVTAISIVVTGPIASTSSRLPAATPIDTADGTPSAAKPPTHARPTMTPAAALGADVPGQRAVHVLQVLFAPPRQLLAREHAQRRSTKARPHRQEEKRHRRDGQPRRVSSGVDQRVEGGARLPLDVADEVWKSPPPKR